MTNSIDTVKIKKRFYAILAQVTSSLSTDSGPDIENVINPIKLMDIKSFRLCGPNEEIYLKPSLKYLRGFLEDEM